jgi:hypothetical protein
VQQQAKQAADALQQQVTAALSSGPHSGPLLLPQHAPHTPAGVCVNSWSCVNSRGCSMQAKTKSSTRIIQKRAGWACVCVCGPCVTLCQVMLLNLAPSHHLDSAHRYCLSTASKLTLSLRAPRHTGRHTLWHLLQRVRAAAPSLAVHLFRSASDRMLCSLDSGSSRPVDPDKGQPMDTAAVSHISAYVDEVSWLAAVECKVQVSACGEGQEQPPPATAVSCQDCGRSGLGWTILCDCQLSGAAAGVRCGV